MLKKDLSVPFITLSLLLGFSSIASAGTWSPSQAWGEQQASYAPDYGNTSMYDGLTPTTIGLWSHLKLDFVLRQMLLLQYVSS